MIHVRLLFCRFVPGMISLHHLLLLLPLCHCSSLIIFFGNTLNVFWIFGWILFNFIFIFWCLIQFYLHNWFFYY
jgi:hypothetical protein